MPNYTPNKDQEVSITEQGILDIIQETTTVTGTGTKYVDLVPPTGKQWRLKALEFTRGAGFTYSGIIISIKTSSQEIDIDSQSIAGTGRYVFVNDIILNEDIYLRVKFTVDSYTNNGDAIVNLLRVESSS